jgi:hypothetical protein
MIEITTISIRYNKRLYRQRNCIERVLGHSKSTAPSPHDMINAPIATSECYILQLRLAG